MPPPPSEMRSGARVKITLIGAPSARRPTRSGVEPVERALHRLGDRQPRAPSPRARSARAVEVDQRAVADPPAGAAGVVDARRRRPGGAQTARIDVSTSDTSSVPRLKTDDVPAPSERLASITTASMQSPTYMYDLRWRPSP